MSVTDQAIEAIVDSLSSGIESQDWSTTIAKIDAALLLHAGNSRLLYMKGCMHSELGENEAAITAFEASADNAGELAINPLYNLANLHKRVGNVQEALNTYQRVLDLDPTMADSWINMGSLLDDLGEHQAALDCYDAALLVDNQDPMTWSNRGNSLRSLAQMEEAEKSYEQALALDEEDYGAMLGLGVCMVERGDATGLPHVEKAYAVTRNPIALFELGMALCKVEQFDNAVECFDLLITEEIADPAIWNNRGECLVKVGRVEDSLESFDRAIAIQKDFAAAYFGKARVLANLERLEEARAVADQLREIASSEFLAGPSVQALLSLCRPD